MAVWLADETKVKRRLGGAELPSPSTSQILPLANGAKNSFPLFELWTSSARVGGSFPINFSFWH